MGVREIVTSCQFSNFLYLTVTHITVTAPTISVLIYPMIKSEKTTTPTRNFDISYKHYKSTTKKKQKNDKYQFFGHFQINIMQITIFLNNNAVQIRLSHSVGVCGTCWGAALHPFERHLRD